MQHLCPARFFIFMRINDDDDDDQPILVTGNCCMAKCCWSFLELTDRLQQQNGVPVAALFEHTSRVLNQQHVTVV